MKKLIMFAVVAFAFAGVAFSQSETPAVKNANVAVAQEEIAPAVSKKECSKSEDGKKACCKKDASAAKASCDKTAKKECKDGGKKDCCKKGTAASDKKECKYENGEKKACCKKETASASEKKQCSGEKKACCNKTAEAKS